MLDYSESTIMPIPSGNINAREAKKSSMILPIILAGGSDTRLWPMSHGNYPKQFLALHGELTML